MTDVLESTTSRHASTGVIKQYRASDGEPLHFRHWETPNPAAWIVGLHGIQSHSGWYELSSDQLRNANCDVRFLDRRGSGLNTSQRGHVDHYERLLHDVTQVLRRIRWRKKRTGSTAPVVLLAVSWGAKLAAAVAALHSDLVDGLALLYPGLCPRIKANAASRWMIRFAERTGSSRIRIRVPLEDPKLFTQSSEWQQFIRDDQHALRKVTIGMLNAGLELDRLLKTSIGNVRCPSLMMLAGQDRILDNDATQSFFQRFGSEQRKIIEYPTAHHTLEFEPNRQQITEELTDWIRDLSGR